MSDARNQPGPAMSSVQTERAAAAKAAKADYGQKMKAKRLVRSKQAKARR